MRDMGREAGQRAEAARIQDRGLSYDRNTGRIPVDFSAENNLRLPAEIRGVFVSPARNPLASRRNQGHMPDYAF